MRTEQYTRHGYDYKALLNMSRCVITMGGYRKVVVNIKRPREAFYETWNLTTTKKGLRLTQIMSGISINIIKRG